MGSPKNEVDSGEKRSPVAIGAGAKISYRVEEEGEPAEERGKFA